MKSTKTLLLVAAILLIIMIITTITMSIFTIRTVNTQHTSPTIPVDSIIVDSTIVEPTAIESTISITLQYHDIEIANNMHFAGERVPLEMFNIKERYERELLSNTYFHSNTIVLLKRSKRWFPIIEPILKKHNIPDDFKYLCVIESYLTNVVSPAGATGFWQFMKNTALEYGLEINDEIDMRYNVEAETEAACKYFLKAYERFGNWTLVAAAYNTGTARVAKFMEEQGVNSYYDLLMSNETERYIFRILAIKSIFEDPEKYGFFISDFSKYEPYKYKTITIKESIDNLAEFAKQHNITYKLLKVFNPWLRSNSLNVTEGNVYEIKIPEDPFNVTHGLISNLSSDEQFHDNDSIVSDNKS